MYVWMFERMGNVRKKYDKNRINEKQTREKEVLNMHVM